MMNCVLHVSPTYIFETSTKETRKIMVVLKVLEKDDGLSSTSLKCFKKNKKTRLDEEINENVQRNCCEGLGNVSKEKFGFKFMLRKSKISCLLEKKKNQVVATV